jgi:hypothetical protein
MDEGEFKPFDPFPRLAAASGLPDGAGSGNSSATAAARGRRAPVDLGDLDMRIARNGSWHYRGSPIGRIPLVKLFASVLRREADGSYWLVTPAERGRITVEDAPFLAVALSVEGEGREQRLIFRTNLDEIVTAGAEHPLSVETAAGGEPAPYILVRDALEAKLTRAVFYELVEYGVAERSGNGAEFGVWSTGVFFRLGEAEPEES